LRILFLHTFYSNAGGEDAVFSQELNLLKTYHDVRTLTFKNKPGLVGGVQFITSIWNVFASKRLKRAIMDIEPDVVHLHNWHFASGPLIIRTASKYNIPVVVTLHNYRLLCPSATLLDGDQVYLESLKSVFPWKGIRKGLYRKSTFQTFWLALIMYFHAKIGTWNMVTKYITLTEFSKKLFLQNNLGITKSKFLVKPNFVSRLPTNELTRSSCFLFLGRLSTEKGIKVLLEAFKTINCNLSIGGSGDYKEEILLQTSLFKNMRYLGSLNAQEVRSCLGECSALVFPSIWFEGMPMTILEAFSLGTPVIASRIGNMSEIIVDGFNGLLFNVGDPDDLRIKLEYWDNLNESEKSRFSLNARQTYEDLYSPEKNLNMLLDIYKEAQLSLP